MPGKEPQRLFPYSWAEATALAIFFAIASILSTWPLVLHLNTVVFGQGDNLQILLSLPNSVLSIWLANLLVIILLWFGHVFYTLLLHHITNQKKWSAITALLLILATTNLWRGAMMDQLLFLYILFPIATLVFLEAYRKRSRLLIGIVATCGVLISAYSLDWILALLVIPSAFFLVELWENRKKWRSILQDQFGLFWIAAYGVGIVITSGIALVRPAPRISDTRHGRILVENSVSPFDWVTPQHWFLDTGIAYVGVGLIMLLLLGMVWVQNRRARMWIGIATAAAVLSLGPLLQFGGRVDPPLPLPYAIITQYFPWEKLLTNPSLFFLPTLLGILAIVTLTAAIAFTKKRSDKVLATVLLCVAAVEVPFLPVQTQQLDAVSTYTDLADIPVEEGEYLLDLRRNKFDADLPNAMKKYIESRYSHIALFSAADAPGNSAVVYRIENKTFDDIFPAGTKEEYTARANEEGIEAIVLSKYDNSHNTKLRRVQTVLKTSLLYSNEEVTVLEVGTEKFDGPRIVPEGNWSNPRLTRQAGNLYRWARNRSSITLDGYETPPSALHLTFDTRQAQEITIRSNGIIVKQEEFPVGKHTIVVPLEDHPENNNAQRVEFKVREQIKIFQADFF